MDLADRGRALENEFFAKENQKLIDAINAEKKKNEETKQISGALLKAIGVSDKQLVEEIRQSGISPLSLAALTLFPLVWVAWSDGSVHDAEQHAVLKAAKEDGLEPDSAGYLMLQHWLANKPSDSVFEVWKDFVTVWRSGDNAEHFSKIAQTIYDRSERIARQSGGIIGIGSISVEEKQALETIKGILDLYS